MILNASVNVIVLSWFAEKSTKCEETAMLNACTTTRIYCRENCPPGRRTKPEHRVSFESEALARSAGYRACKVCKPDVFSGAWQPKALAKV
jgi:methylphosphotriester-DNA--protein-cysteine methyltransferase